MSVSTPLIRRLRDNSGTLVCLGSCQEDIGLNLFQRNQNVALSHYALLNLPSANTVAAQDASIDVNNFNLTNIPGHLSTVFGTNTKRTSSWQIAASLQNYLMNFETVLLNQETYNYQLTNTVSERCFWKWLSETGAIRFVKANLGTDETYFTEFPETKQITDSTGAVSSILTGYNRVVKCFGEISATNSVSGEFGMSNEVYCNIPTSYGSPLQYFKQVEDQNYKLGEVYTSSSATYLEGRDANTNNSLVYTVNTPFADNADDAYLPHIFTTDNLGNKQMTSKTWWEAEGISLNRNSAYKCYVTNKRISDLEADENIEAYGFDKETLSFSMSFDSIGTEERDPTAYPKDFKKTAVDGVSLVKRISELRKIYGARDNEEITSDITLDDINTNESYVVDKEFQFNAVLLYYTVYDSQQKIPLATNLFGILFLDSPVYSSNNGVDNSGAHLNFYIPPLTKKKSDDYGFGTGFSFRINVKTLSIYDNTDAYINDQTTSASIQGDDFNEVLHNLNRSIEILNTNAATTKKIADKYIEIYNNQKSVMDDVISLKEKVNNILANKFGAINCSTLEADIAVKSNVFTAPTTQDTTDDYMEFKFLDTSLNSYQEPVLRLDRKNGAFMPKTDVSVLKQDNDYQIINYKTNNLYDVSDETIQDLIKNMKVILAETAVEEKSEVIDSEGNVGYTQTNSIEYIISPESFQATAESTINKLNYLLRTTNETAIDDTSISYSEINYLKVIPLLVRFCQCIDPDYLSSGLVFVINNAFNDEIINVDADGTLEPDEQTENYMRLTFDYTLKRGSLAVKVYYKVSDVGSTEAQDVKDYAWIYFILKNLGNGQFEPNIEVDDEITVINKTDYIGTTVYVNNNVTSLTASIVPNILSLKNSEEPRSCLIELGAKGQLDSGSVGAVADTKYYRYTIVQNENATGRILPTKSVKISKSSNKIGLIEREDKFSQNSSTGLVFETKTINAIDNMQPVIAQGSEPIILLDSSTETISDQE